MVVASFGHKDTPSSVKPLLEQTVQRLIEENEEITFLVGTHGAFDLMVYMPTPEPHLHGLPTARRRTLYRTSTEQNRTQNEPAQHHVRQA